MNRNSENIQQLLNNGGLVNQLEGGTNNGGKKSCCGKKDEGIKRNKKMFFRKFNGQRNCQRFKKIFKNLVIASIIYGITTKLLDINRVHFYKMNCSLKLDPHYSHGHSKTEEFKDNAFDGTICYQTAYNQYVLQLIWDLNILWVVFKVLKADMGFRCTCSPKFTKFIQILMAIIRIGTFFYEGVYYALPQIVYHCIYTYIVVWQHVSKLIF